MFFVVYSLSFNRVSVDQMKKLLRRFAQIDRNKDGLISVEDLSYFLRVHQDSCFNALFDKLDTVRSFDSMH